MILLNAWNPIFLPFCEHLIMIKCTLLYVHVVHINLAGQLNEMITFHFLQNFVSSIVWSLSQGQIQGNLKNVLCPSSKRDWMRRQGNPTSLHLD